MGWFTLDGYSRIFREINKTLCVKVNRVLGVTTKNKMDPQKHNNGLKLETNVCQHPKSSFS